MLDGGELIGLVAVVLIFGIPIVGIICWAIVKSLGKDKGKERDPEETRMIQEIYNGLEKMETRIDSLETILYDQK